MFPQDLMKTQDQKSESKKSECQIKLNELKTIGMLGSGAFGLVSGANHKACVVVNG